MDSPLTVLLVFLDLTTPMALNQTSWVELPPHIAPNDLQIL